MYIPPFALRDGVSAVRSMASYLIKFLSIGAKGALLTGPFTNIMDKYELKEDFNRKWFDYLAFALSGLDAAHTQAAPVLYTMGDLHNPGAVLDYPMGGMQSLTNALVKGLTDHNGELRLNSRVEKLILKNENECEAVGISGGAKCHGVILQDGTVVKARKGVVSNAPLWNMAKILEDSVDENNNSDAIGKAVKEVRKQADDMEMTGSFMHLHLGIPADGIDEDIECHHSMLNMNESITAEQNLAIVSIPTVFDPSLAPEGYHIVTKYMPIQLQVRTLRTGKNLWKRKRILERSELVLIHQLQLSIEKKMDMTPLKKKRLKPCGRLWNASFQMCENAQVERILWFLWEAHSHIEDIIKGFEARMGPHLVRGKKSGN